MFVLKIYFNDFLFH